MNEQKDNPGVEEIDCLEAIDSLYAYLDGELKGADTLSRFKQHLDHCKSCYTRAELEGVISERIKRSGKEKAPESLQARLRSLMDEL